MVYSVADLSSPQSSGESVAPNPSLFHNVKYGGQYGKVFINSGRQDYVPEVHSQICEEWQPVSQTCLEIKPYC
jgi:hypothetical protein